MKFSDVLEIKNGRNQKQVENPNGIYPIYGSGGIMGWADSYICDAHTVIIGRKGTINNPIYVDCPFWNVDTAFGLVANRDVLLPKYLFYFCCNFDFEKLNTTVTIPSLTKLNLLNIEICVPPIDTQQQIINRLDQVENLIELRKNQLEQLNLLVKSRFIELFGDPVRNEKGWSMTALSEMAEIRIGPFGTLLHKEDYISGGHALVNPSHIIDGKIRVDTNLSVSDEKYEELAAYHLSVGDIVLGRRGEMGRCAVVYEEGLLCGTGSLIIRPNNKMHPYFLQTIISSPTFKKTIEDKAVGVTMLNLNVPIVSSLVIPQLPITMQEQFIEFMEQTDKLKFTVRNTITIYTTLILYFANFHWERRASVSNKGVKP